MFRVTLYKKLDRKQPVHFAGDSQEELFDLIKQWMDEDFKGTRNNGHRSLDCNGLSIIKEDDDGTVLMFDPRDGCWYIGPLNYEEGTEDKSFDSFQDARDEFLKLIEELAEFSPIEEQISSDTVDVYTANPCPALE